MITIIIIIMQKNNGVIIPMIMIIYDVEMTVCTIW